MICVHDLFVLCAALPAAVLLQEDFMLSKNLLLPLCYGTGAVALFAGAALAAAGAHRTMWRYLAPRDLISVAQLVSLVMLALCLCWLSFSVFEPLQRSVLLIFWLIAFTGLVMSRLFYGYGVQILESWRDKAERFRASRILIFGDAADGAVAVRALRAHAGGDLEIVGAISDRMQTGRRFDGTAILGDVDQLPSILASLRARGRYPQWLIHAGWNEDDASLTNLKRAVIAVDPELGVFSVREAFRRTDWLTPSDRRARHFDRTPSASSYFRIKRLLDFCFASAALCFCTPLLSLIAAIGWMAMGSPTFFSQVRAGRHLREFSLHKFRTMHDLSDASGKLLSDEERTTRLGRFLRATRLDELPQLWNVVRGDMSLVGPRPLLPRDMPEKEAILLERYAVRPGLTGWAQVNGGHQLPRDQKMALDLYYIRHASLVMDFKILVLTFRTIIFGERIDAKAVERATALSA